MLGFDSNDIDETFIGKRITELRKRKGVSEYQMSLDIGRSKNYIQNIRTGRSLPSLPELFNICSYLQFTPKDFFDRGK
ncbi:MAG: helix-turn-helix domain-containing protein [Oscillospiraceae bacterium]|nr:helix-turn-helix domain-containing protein [Oscillospiraceae bacterium]